MSDAWEAAQDRLRGRLWAARVAHDPAGREPPPALCASLQPPELLAPAIAGHRSLLGGPIRLLKRTLHRLLVPVVFAPQAEFNLRVAERLSELAELQGEVRALRAELQAQRALVQEIRQAGATAPGDAPGARTG